jgi:hypothetical protein
MENLKIYPIELNADQGLELQSVLQVSRAIFSADGQRETQDVDSGDTLSELVTSAPGGSFKRILKDSLEPGNLPLLRPYDHASGRIPGFKLATVNLEMSYRAIERDTVKEGKRHGEILILDKKTRYYEAIIRHLVNREDPEQPLETNYAVPLEELLTPFEYRVTERFKYSDDPESAIEHSLGISANWYRPVGELNADDSLKRLALNIGYVLQPAEIAEPSPPKQIKHSLPESLSA